MCSKNRFSRIHAALGLVLAVLCVLLLAEGLPLLPQAGNSGALVFVPKTHGGQGISVSTLADTLDGKLVYTYESHKASVLHTDIRTANVQLFSVNHAYAQVTGLPLVSGSFFTQNAETTRARHIVLNTRTAFALFGGNDVAGMTVTLADEMYEVVGVLDDGLDEPAAYAPAVVTGDAAQAFMALPDGANGLSAAHILSLMKQAGVTNTTYRIADTGKLAAMPLGKALFAGSILLVLILAALTMRALRHLRGLFAALRERHKRLYLREMLRRETLLLLRTALCLLAALTFAAGAFALLLAWMNLFLIYDPIRLLREWSAYDWPHFAAVLTPFCAANGQSSVLLVLMACVSACFGMLCRRV